METQQGIDKLIQATKRYEFADGLRDLQQALMMAFFAAFIWLTFEEAGIRWFVAAVLLHLRRIFGVYTSWASLALLALFLLALLGCLQWMMGWIRRRWLWRRQGWVKPHRWMMPRWVSVLSVAVILISLGIAVVLLQRTLITPTTAVKVLWTATGWGYGIGIIGFGKSMGLRRYLWLGVIGCLISTLPLLLPLSVGKAGGLLYSGWAFALVISGGITLRQALSDTQRAEQYG